MDIALVGLLGTIVGAVIAMSSNAIISAKNRSQQLRLAALEKRIDAHQKAYALCNLLYRNWGTQKTPRNEIQDQFLQFWDNYCLYLSSSSRDLLRKVFDVYVEFGVKGVGGTIGADFHNAHKEAIETLASEISLPSPNKNHVEPAGGAYPENAG